MNNYCERLYRPYHGESHANFINDLFHALDVLGVRTGGEFFITTMRPNDHGLDGPGQARKKDPPTSKSAAEQLGRAGNKRRAVLAAIARAGERGLTSEEAVEVTGIEYRTLTPRIGELKRGGFIVALEDVTRPGTHGAQQQVLVATRKGALEADNRRAL